MTTVSALPGSSTTPTPVSSPEPFPSAGIPDSGPASGAYPPVYPGATASNGIVIPDASLNCRLPIYAGPSGSGGFIVFPGGTFVADPASAVALPSSAPGQPSPAPQYSNGSSQMSYDAQFSRWVPVARSHLAPDGSVYAFESTSSIYLENVASGTLSQVGEGHAWTIVSVQAAGVYATQPNAAGLWLVPFAGTPRQITTAGYWQVGGADYAYGTPTSAVPNGVSNVLIRVDFKSGTVSDWFTRQGGQSSAIGLDGGGNVIIQVSYYTANVTEIWISTGAGKGTPIAGSDTGLTLSGLPVADSHGIWFGGIYGTYYNAHPGFVLYVPGRGLYWMSNVNAFLAGGCVKP